MDIFISLVVMAAIYMAPWLVALARFHRQKTAIFALNLLTGWTFFGWVGAFVWSCTANTEGR